MSLTPIGARGRLTATGSLGGPLGLPAASGAAMDIDAAPLAAASSQGSLPAGWLESELTNELARQGVGSPTHPPPSSQLKIIQCHQMNDQGLSAGPHTNQL
jgi:hypothetical protein